ncbi:MAG: hypothetical protein AAF587_08970 [Bacteroidota bacterium]
MKKRLIYIAGTANDPDIGRYIQQDISNMKDIFEYYEDRGRLLLRTDEMVDTELLLNRLQNESGVYPWLFYFSGHSSLDQIQLADKPQKIETFVKLFDDPELLKHLHIVYLSSCESIDIGHQLNEVGVKVVIVTREKIPAFLANVASSIFFRQLMRVRNIELAFELTKVSYQAQRSVVDYSQGNIREPEFPFEILSNQEETLRSPLPRINLRPEEEAVIKLHLLDSERNLRQGFIEHGRSHSLPINTKYLRENTMESQKELKRSLEIVEEEQTLVDLLDNLDRSSLGQLSEPGKGSKRKKILIKEVKNPVAFKRSTTESIRRMITIDDEILSSYK